MNLKLKKLFNHSYSPYSNLQVAAIVVTNDGQFFNGVNVENAAYGDTICAEKVAITSAIANGYKPYDFHELHLAVSTGKLIMPCGSCRQFIAEMFGEDKKIIVHSNEESQTFVIGELLPYGFSKQDI